MMSVGVFTGLLRLLLDQGKFAEAWELTARRERRIDWELQQQERTAMMEHDHLYWGCVTYCCERGQTGCGQTGRRESMPREWARCPDCRNELTEITCTCQTGHPEALPVTSAERQR